MINPASTLWSEDSEQRLLGILLAEPKTFDTVAWMKPDWIYIPVHARIFEAIAEHRRIGKAVSADFMAQYFAHDQEISDAGGAQYLRELAHSVVTIHAAADYAKHIRTLHLRRMLIEKAEEIKTMSLNADPFTTAEQILDGAENLLAQAREVKSHETTVSAADSAKVALQLARNPVRGILTGFAELNKFIAGGLKAAELTVIAGRPGMGKTAMGLTLAVNAAEAGNNVLFFSLEMSHAQLMQRVLSRYSRQAVHSGETYNSMDDAMSRATNLPLHIDDASGLTALDICARAAQHKRRKGLDMVVVDYLGLVTAMDKKANKTHQIEEITQGMKRLSKDLQIPVILLSQLSRAVEGREEKRPTLGDLRDSGSIEQDADTVMFVYREEYYEKKKTTGYKPEAERLAEHQVDKNAAELIVAKNRQGRLGTVHLKFDGREQVFYE